MTEDQLSEPWDDPDVMLERPERTGLTRVDAVLDAVSSLGSTALPEQVAVYEHAHVELRAALDDPGTAADD